MRLAPHREEVGAAELPPRSPLVIIDEFERGAAAIGTVVVPRMFADVVRARAVVILSAPAQLLWRAQLRLAPDFDAGGFAVLREVAPHAFPRVLSANAAANTAAPSRSWNDSCGHRQSI